MKKKAPQFTYTVSGQDGQDFGPFDLPEMKQRIASGEIDGATFVCRSDSDQWATAADFSELEVKDVVVGRYDHEAGPNALAREMEEAGYARPIRAGSSWFFWIAAMSSINAMLAFVGSPWRYCLGLAIMFPIGEVGQLLGPGVALVGLMINLSFVALFFFFGVAGWQKQFLPYLIGMGLFAGDAVVAFASDDWLSAGIHVLALICMYWGLNAHLVRRDMNVGALVLIPAAASLILVAGGGLFLNSRLHVEAREITSPEPWVRKPQNTWPDLVLSHSAEFRGHSSLSGASAFLVQLPDKKVIAVTARHLLGPEGGVEPTLRVAEINEATVKWQLHPRAKPDNVIAVTGLFGRPNHYRSLDDCVLLRVDEKNSKPPATPLRLRFTPLTLEEKVYVVGVRYDNAKKQQEVFRGKVTNPFGIVEGEFEKPANLEGFSGAPILDEAGHVVGVVTGTRSEADKNGNYATFAGHGTEEISRLLRAAAFQSQSPGSK